METLVSRRDPSQNMNSTSNVDVDEIGRGARFSAQPKTVMNLSNVISMDDRITRNQPARAGVRDRRYAIRFPFAADVEIIDMESGTRAVGVTSDISMGGCFVCTSKPLSVATRVRITLTRKGQRIEALAVVRILKPRIGMGIEFIDVESEYHDLLCRWIEQIRQSR
jgi:PilZ domain